VHDACFMLVSCLAYYSALKIKAICSPETSVEFQRITRPCIPEDATAQINFCIHCKVFPQSKNCGARKTAVASERPETIFASRQRLGKHVPATTDTHATIEVLLETVFSARSL
jgi:hypothetical protein